MLPFSDHNKLSETSQPLQVSSAGGVYSAKDKIPYQLSFAKDQQKGEEPITIKDDSKDLIKFNEALELVKDEKQVLILIDTYVKWFFYETNAKKITKGFLHRT